MYCFNQSLILYLIYSFLKVGRLLRLDYFPRASHLTFGLLLCKYVQCADLYGVYRDRRGGCAGCILRYNCYLLPRLDLASPASSAGAGVSENRKCRD